MSRAEVDSAATQKGVTLTEASNSRPEQVELITHYTTLGFQFVTRLIFNHQQALTEVVLVQTNWNQCEPLAEIVKSAYGVPYDVYPGYGLRTWSWRDEKEKNNVMFRLVGVPSSNRWCDINYSALNDPHKLGL